MALAFLTLSSNSSHAGWFEDAVKGGLGSIRVRPEEGSSANARTAIRKGDGKVHHVAVGVNGTFVKA